MSVTALNDCFNQVKKDQLITENEMTQCLDNTDSLFHSPPMLGSTVDKEEWDLLKSIYSDATINKANPEPLKKIIENGHTFTLPGWSRILATIGGGIGGFLPWLIFDAEIIMEDVIWYQLIGISASRVSPLLSNPLLLVGATVALGALGAYLITEYQLHND